MEVTVHDHQHYNWEKKSKHIVSNVYVTKILTYVLFYSIYNTFIT